MMFTSRCTTSRVRVVYPQRCLSLSSTDTMVSEYRQSFAQGYIFLANVLNTAKIDRLVLPDVIQSGSLVDLDCEFSGVGEHFSMQWWFDAGAGHGTMVYEWSPGLPPTIAGVLEGRIGLSSSATNSPKEEYRVVHLLRTDPDMSGEYTCVLINNGAQIRKSKNMLVYNPEEEFELTIKKGNQKMAEITCVANGMYPQPELILEYKNEPIVQQVQRVWHMNSMLRYAAETKAQMRIPYCKHLEVTCRLHLPQADYTAIKKRLLTSGHRCSRGVRQCPMTTFSTLLGSFIVAARLLE